MSAPDGAGLWANPELARAYAEVRTDLSPAARAVWADALRAGWTQTSAPRRVLDVGCGTGRFTTFLSEVFDAPTLGVDASAEMLRGRASSPATSPAFLAADAAALPLRAGAVDVALLSMVYHFLKPPGPAIAELHRVVRGQGLVFVRTPTRELLDRVEFLAFFPDARAVDEARMPSRAALRATFEHAGFATHAWRIVEQEFATTPLEALERVRRRAFSTLRLISDDAFEAGLARYEAHCLAAPPTPRAESLELFVFQRA
jgi:SAM-dependent methyltransferase